MVKIWAYLIKVTHFQTPHAVGISDGLFWMNIQFKGYNSRLFYPSKFGPDTMPTNIITQFEGYA